MFWVFFSWGLFLVSNHCDLSTFDMISISWICSGLFCVLLCGLSLKMFHVHLKRMCILLLWDEKFYIYLLSPFDLRHCLMPQYPCYFGRSVQFWQWGIKIPYYNCIAVYIFPEVLQDFPYILWCSCVGCIQFYNVYVFLMDSSFEYYEVSFRVSFYGLCFEVYFVWYKYRYLAFLFLTFDWNIFF